MVVAGLILGLCPSKFKKAYLLKIFKWYCNHFWKFLHISDLEKCLLALASRASDPCLMWPVPVRTKVIRNGYDCTLIHFLCKARAGQNCKILPIAVLFASAVGVFASVIWRKNDLSKILFSWNSFKFLWHKFFLHQDAMVTSQDVFQYNFPQCDQDITTTRAKNIDGYEDLKLDFANERKLLLVI